MQKTALLFGLFPTKSKHEIISNHRGVVQYAADALQWSIVEGLNYWLDDITIINLPFLSGYPLGYKKAFNESYRFEYKKCKGRNISFCNLSGYNQLSRFINAKNALRKWIKESDRNRIIIVYALTAPLISAASSLKKEFQDLKIISIAPDLPEFMSDNESPIYQLYKKISMSILKRACDSIDGYVLLTKYMREREYIQDKPWIVIEGIYSDEDNQEIIPQHTPDEKIKTILYAGTLAKRYGIMNLVEAFIKTTNPNYRLVIYGAGEMANQIVNYSTKDNRIIFKGQQPREEILLMQRSATLLVNPRPNEEEYTKYSFPSKTMEYLASGIPSLICKLPGIPEEYYKYCYSLTEMSVGTLHVALNQALEKETQELQVMGKKAREFILKEKNSKVQCKKIVQLINQI